MSQIRKELEEELGKRKPILHVQNVFLSKPLNIYIDRETSIYIIGYEPKSYAVHSLMYKISKNLIEESKNPIIFNDKVNINVQENYRLSTKKTDNVWKIKSKNVVVRIAPSKYENLKPLYGIIQKFGWRRTGAGGKDYITFKIPECPTISNSTTVKEICYKQISTQISYGGSHGTHTYAIISPKAGDYEIGTWIKVSNVNRGGNQHRYEYPVYVNL